MKKNKVNDIELQIEEVQMSKSHILFSWSSSIGFGEYSFFFNDDDKEWEASSETLDSNNDDDKAFGLKLLELLMEKANDILGGKIAVDEIQIIENHVLSCKTSDLLSEECLFTFICDDKEWKAYLECLALNNKDNKALGLKVFEHSMEIVNEILKGKIKVIE